MFAAISTLFYLCFTSVSRTSQRYFFSISTFPRHLSSFLFHILLLLSLPICQPMAWNIKSIQ